MTTIDTAIEQHKQFKQQYPGFVLLFRFGDFYEMFFDDATIGAKVLGLPLISRQTLTGGPVPMAGVPFHAVENYLKKLIASGHKVALCEPTE